MELDRRDALCGGQRENARPREDILFWGLSGQMTDATPYSGLSNKAAWRAFVPTRDSLRFHRALPYGERMFLASMLALIGVAGFILYLVTPVPFASLARGMSLYLMLPLVSVSIVWGVIRVAEKIAGHRFAVVHARGQWMLATAIATSSVIPVYGLFKQYVLKARGFPMDAALAEIDRFFLFGFDAWEITHHLFPSIWATILLDRAYGFWLPILMFCPVLWAALVADPIVRARLIACWIGVWVFVGGLAAWLLASAGPMYYPHFIGPDASFSALHDQIVAQGQLAREAGNIVATPIGHILLMKRYETGIYMPGFGISAMPSVHVSMSVMFAIGGFVLRRWIGWALALYAAIIWLGSIHLGWHYAADGIVGAALTIGMWKASAHIAKPFERRLSALEEERL